jgi:hypothetical protein
VRLMQVVFFALALVILARLWGINGVAVAADLMMLSGTAALLAYSRRLVSFSLPRLFGWPAVAVAASSALGYALIRGIRWTGLWQGLIFKGLAVSATYGLILYWAERQIIHEYSSQILRPLRNKWRARAP